MDKKISSETKRRSRNRNIAPMPTQGPSNQKPISDSSGSRGARVFINSKPQMQTPAKTATEMIVWGRENPATIIQKKREKKTANSVGISVPDEAPIVLVAILERGTTIMRLTSAMGCQTIMN